MCKSKMAINASEPTAKSSRTSRATEPTFQTPRASSHNGSPKAMSLPSVSSNPSSTSNATASGNYTSNSYNNSRTSRETIASLSSLRDLLPETPNLYNFSEICSATNNFLAKKHSSPSSSAASWRCTLRGRDVIVFQRKFRRPINKGQQKDRLSKIYRSHHTSIVKLLGALISGDNYIYLVYDFVIGASLEACLRNPRNPNFTILGTWISRMQVAADLAHGLDYIHNNTGLDTDLVHNHIKSSSIIVTEPSFTAKICHFGTAQLCGESEDPQQSVRSKGKNTEITSEDDNGDGEKTLSSSPVARGTQFEGVRGYMSPEFQSTGFATQKSDVYAFGVVILELLSGEEPLKYKYNKNTNDFTKTSVIDTATAAIDGYSTGDDKKSGEEWSREGRVRSWIDPRLKDSFPVQVAERVTRVALECVHVDPNQRPNMRRVAGKISKLFLESEKWSRKIKMPTEISVSLGPR